MSFGTLFPPVLALLLGVAIILFGYAEMQRDRARTNGLTTWCFALGPFGGCLLGIWYMDSLAVATRAVLIAVLTGAIAAGVTMLFRQALDKRVQPEDLPGEP